MSEEKANELIAAITALSSLVSVIADDITAKNAAAAAAGMEAADLREEADAKYEEAAKKSKEAREIKEMRVRIDADGNYIEVEE